MKTPLRSRFPGEPWDLQSVGTLGIVDSTMLGSVALVALVLLLAAANGANDNFKGVATLYGSGTCTFRSALALATVLTFLGSLLSVTLASSLARAFSGKGLIDDGLIDPSMLLAISAAAMTTIALATILGLPTSTTHALTGALVGAALVAAGTEGVAWLLLLRKFATPLLLSPFLAIVASATLYLVLRRIRRAVGLEATHRLDLEAPGLERSIRVPSAIAVLAPSPRVVRRQAGEALSGDTLLRVSPSRLVDKLHFLSGGAVCFARAVNDTPKIAALLIAMSVVGDESVSSPRMLLLLVAVVMTAGGLVSSRNVAETMSHGVTKINQGQGLVANLVTSFLVLVASRLGLPVSTTHVSCGAIFGLAAANRTGRRSTITRILLAWVVTLPLAMGLAAGIYLVLRGAQG